AGKDRHRQLTEGVARYRRHQTSAAGSRNEVPSPAGGDSTASEGSSDPPAKGPNATQYAVAGGGAGSERADPDQAARIAEEGTGSAGRREPGPQRHSSASRGADAGCRA